MPPVRNDASASRHRHRAPASPQAPRLLEPKAPTATTDLPTRENPRNPTDDKLPPMARIAIVGGGLAGLCAAYRLSRARHSVLVLEADNRLGGQIHTARSAGFVAELGAEGYVARSEALPKLARELGIERELVGQTELRSLGYRSGQLQVLAPGESASFLGFQVAKADLGEGIRTLRMGMGQLIEALEQNLASGVEMRTGFRVQQIERQARGFSLRASDGAGVIADKLIIATSAHAAAPLLGAQIGPAALDLARVTAHSSVNVSMAFARAAIAHPLDATGVVFAQADQLHGCRACVFASTKFADRAPEGQVNLRVFFRPDPRELKMLSDAEYKQRALQVLERVVGPTGPADKTWVARWPDALPVFDAESKQILQALETALKSTGITVAGSAFHGSGIDAAVRSGLSVDQRL
jgi:protoporphyrinogen/coproporphyrinogen III oxidase